MEEAATGVEIYMHVKYVGHIAVMAGRIRETIALPARSTITDLLSALDKNYPGFKEVFMPVAGVFNSRTGIICRRLAQPGFGVVDENMQLRNGDILTLW